MWENVEEINQRNFFYDNAKWDLFLPKKPLQMDVWMLEPHKNEIKVQCCSFWWDKTMSEAYEMKQRKAYMKLIWKVFEAHP